MQNLLTVTAAGLYCEQGDFYLDPLRPVAKAVISHAHADHARPGMKSYLSHPLTAKIMKSRISENLKIDTLNYGEELTINGVKVSLHPAGHIAGSAQIRLEYKGQIWVYTGDYNTVSDSTVENFELVKCHNLITECTFGLPVFRWQESGQIYSQIRNWITECQTNHTKPVLLAYALGKAQRLINELREYTFAAHGAVQQVNKVLKDTLKLDNTFYINSETKKDNFDIIIAPPSVFNTGWLKRFGEISCAFVSGWMTIRGNRRRQSYDRGFALSDHADFMSLFAVAKASQAQHVYTTHGYSAAFAKFLNENSIAASELEITSNFIQSDSDQEVFG